MNKKLIASSVLTFLALPAVILAVFNPGEPPVSQTTLSINALIQIIFDIIWPVAVAFFIIMFIIAAFKFASAGGDPAKVQEARSFVIWGAVGVAVAVLAFSIPFVVKNLVQPSP